MLHIRESMAKTCGMVFLGTPHRGSELANWSSVLLGLVPSVATSINTDVVGTLQREGHELDKLQQAFEDHLREKSDQQSGIQIHCFYEEMDTAPIQVRWLS